MEDLSVVQKIFIYFLPIIIISSIIYVISRGKVFKAVISTFKRYSGHYILSGCCLFVSYHWLFEYIDKGYYLDGRSGMIISGEEALITIYPVLIIGYSILFYVIVNVITFKK